MLTQAKTAADLMATDVVTVAPKDTLREAMSLMVDNHVGALPVVDAKGHCVGVISATDILNCEHEQAEEPDHDSELENGAYFDIDAQRWENISVYRGIDEIPERSVKEVMSDNVIFVLPTTSIVEVAQAMTGQGIHHILVLDSERRLRGIISSLDFVSLFAED